ncbi:MAG: DNA polymerase I [Lachnospiraceae bacterium]|nr:DNA polymerase I [Lachnospiraceae bacterium]
MAEKEKIVLIDGHSILNRAFYGIPMLTNSEGLHTNAVYGFLNILFKVLDEEKADYAAVAFDLKAPTFRHKMYDGYKGTRKPMPQELHEQVPLMKEMLEAMKIPVLTLEGYEADDILGTVSHQMQAEGLCVSVVSGDRDLLQLATDEICIRIPKTKATGTEVEDYFAKDVEARYMVTPQQFIDVKALMGDSSDNIPGVPGIGEKTATKIIAQFGSIENAHENLETVTPPRAREAIRNHYELAQMSKTLATIDLHAPIILEKEKAKIENLYTPEAKQLCRRLEFKNILSKFADDPEETEQERQEELIRVEDLEEAEQVFARASGRNAGFQVIAERNQILGISISIDGDGKAYFIRAAGFLTADYLGTRLSELLASDGCFVTMHLKEQLSYFELLPENRKHLYDAAVAAYLINPLKDSYACEDLAKEYAGRMIASRAELFGKDSLAEVEEEKADKFLNFVCMQSLIPLLSLPKLREKLDELAMTKLFDEIEMPLVYTLYEMEREGILVEADELKKYGEQLTGRISELERQIQEEAGEAFNINSPKQLGVILFEKLQLPHGKKTKTGYSTAADVLDKLAPDYPIVADILEYRQLTKLKSTYADGLANYISPDGRIHGKFHQTITATGRISSTEPNLQNIPVRMELGRLIRKVFIPKPGYVFVDADYSQIELRVLAHFSNDEMLIQAYREAQDIHSITASQVFHVAPEEVTPLLRRNAKAVNFGIVYGISSFGLSQDLSITRKEAQEYIEQYFHTYPGIKEFLDRTVDQAKKNGYVTTLFGRRRPVPELKSSNFMQRSFGERVAMNAPIQGTAADIIKIAMNHVNESLRKHNLKSKLILQVHDELLVETAAEEEAQVREILAEEMQHAAELKVHLEIDMHSGKNWYEAK